MNTLTPTVGLYRHFKGEYYYINNIVKDCTTGLYHCTYFNVCKPHLGIFVRDMNEWFDTETDKGAVVDRPDNVTGQIHRFERVYDLNFQLGSVSTEQLLNELYKREDSPINELDIDGLQSQIDCKDYVLGQYFENEDYVVTVNAFASEEQARKHLASRNYGTNLNLYKRTFIRIK